MAKQNYRCAGCGIRTDPGEATLALYPPGAEPPPTPWRKAPFRGAGRGDRAEPERRKEGEED